MGNEIAKQAPAVANPIPYTSYDPKDGVFCTTDGTAEHVIRYAPSGPASEAAFPATTLPKIFQGVLKSKKANSTALRVERPCPPLVDRKAPPALAPEDWTTWTYQAYYDECCEIAKALISLGVEQHDAVNIFGFNAPEWFIAEMGAIFAGCKAAGVYPTDTPKLIQFKASHSGSKVAFVEDKAKLDKYKIASKELPDLKAIVVWDGEAEDVEGPNGKIPCYTWADFKKLGESVTDEQLTERMDAIKPGHCCALIYTSGTTGPPKAVMISHDNILADANYCMLQMDEIGTSGGEERVLSYLPLSHVAGMMVDIIMPIVATAKRPGWVATSFARSYDLKAGSVGDRLRAVRPTLFLGVPRVWEKVAEKIKKLGAQTKPGLKKSLIGWAKGSSLTHQQNSQLGGSGSAPTGMFIANILLNKVKEKLGLDKCKFGFTGAAPITKETLEFFGGLGIQINEVYGMSENSGATTWSTDNCHVWGSCGYELPGCEVKIFRVDETDLNKKTECPKAKDLQHLSEEEKGEVCFRGRHIMMGYMAQPKLGEEHVAKIGEKLAGAIDAEGWLHSGDQGACDATGMFKITGRYKELIIGAGGENIAPVPIEDNVKSLCPVISNFLVIGDKRKFNVALVTLKAVGATGESAGTDELDGEAAEFNPELKTIGHAANNAAYVKMIEDAIIATNKNGDVCPIPPSTIKKFTILPNDFSIEGDELTATLKTKRSVVDAKYAAAIDAMYDGKATYVCHADLVGKGATEAAEAPAKDEPAEATAEPAAEATTEPAAEATVEATTEATAEAPAEPAAEATEVAKE